MSACVLKANTDPCFCVMWAAASLPSFDCTKQNTPTVFAWRQGLVLKEVFCSALRYSVLPGGGYFLIIALGHGVVQQTAEY